MLCFAVQVLQMCVCKLNTCEFACLTVCVLTCPCCFRSWLASTSFTRGGWVAAEAAVQAGEQVPLSGKQRRRGGGRGALGCTEVCTGEGPGRAVRASSRAGGPGWVEARVGAGERTAVEEGGVRATMRHAASAGHVSARSSVSLHAGFASFERHTTGFASRMMQRMGFEAGQGLGARGQGRAEPVLAEMRPRGLGLGAE